MSSSNCCFLTCIQISQELQLCPTLWDPMDCTRLLCPWDSPGKNTGGVPFPSPRGSSCPKEWTPHLLCLPALSGGFFTSSATWGMRLPLQEDNYLFIYKMETINKLRKILKEMGIPDHLTCLLRNLYVGQEATVRTGHGTDRLVPNWERSTLRLYIVTLLI